MKACRRILSVILAALAAFTCCSSALAQSTQEHLPQVYVEGFESKVVYYKDDPDKNSLLFPIDTDRLMGNLGNFGEYAKKAVSEWEPNIIRSCIYSWMWETFGMTALEPDGVTMSDEVTVDETQLNHRGNGKYVFKYDSRLDPVDLAAQLYDYIALVKQDTGSERYELVGSSFGSAVVVAFLNEYHSEWENIDSVLLCVPSVGGINFVGELFTGNVNFDADAVEAFANSMIDDENISLLLSVLNKSGVLDVLLACAVEPLIKVAVMDALADVVHDIFATHPAMWSFVKDEYFYEALEKVYGKDYNNPEHEYAVLIDKVTYYHENVMNKREEILTDVMNAGTNVSIICKYDKPPFPLSKDGNFMGDGFVELTVASFGATSAMNGEFLPADYVQAKHAGYDFISPDNRIDASTGFLPFSTWYIKGLNHGEKSDGYYELINAIIYEDLNVFSDAKYPQFMEVSQEDDELLVPMAEIERSEDSSLFEDFFVLVKNIIKILIEKIKGLFA